MACNSHTTGPPAKNQQTGGGLTVQTGRHGERCRGTPAGCRIALRRHQGPSLLWRGRRRATEWLGGAGLRRNPGGPPPRCGGGPDPELEPEQGRREAGNTNTRPPDAPPGPACRCDHTGSPHTGPAAPHSGLCPCAAVSAGPGGAAWTRAQQNLLRPTSPGLREQETSRGTALQEGARGPAVSGSRALQRRAGLAGRLVRGLPCARRRGTAPGASLLRARLQLPPAAHAVPAQPIQTRPQRPGDPQPVQAPLGTWQPAALRPENWAGRRASLLEPSFSASLAGFPEGRRRCSPGHKGGKTACSRTSCIPERRRERLRATGHRAASPRGQPSPRARRGAGQGPHDRHA